MISLSKNQTFNFIKYLYPILFLTSVLSLYVTTCNANELSEKDINKLFGGFILVKAIESSGGIPGVMAAFAVPSSREKIWDVLLDYSNFKKIFDSIIDLEVIHQDSKGALVEYWADAVLTDLNYTLYRKYEKHNHKLTWSRISGDLEIIEGSWSIIDSSKSDTKIVVYRSFVKIGGIIPTSFVRWGAMRKAESMCKKLKEQILVFN